MSIFVEWTVNAKAFDGQPLTIEERNKIIDALNELIGDIEYIPADELCYLLGTEYVAEFFTTRYSEIDNVIRQLHECAVNMPGAIIECFADCEDGSGERVLFFGEIEEHLDKITTWEQPKLINWPWEG